VFCLTYESLCREKEVRFEGKGSDLQKKRLDLKKKSSDLQKRGKICKLYSLIKVRIVKSLRSRSFVLCRSKISESFCF
jgi:hypothetical protein